MTASSARRAERDVALSRRRALFGPLTRVLNPFIQRFAGGSRTPVFSLVYHRGRHSGRTYATPVGLGSTGVAFLIPLTFGADADWCRNVLAAGWCSVKWHGRNYTAVEPDVVNDVSVGAELATAFDSLQRLGFRAMGTHEFLRLRITDRQATGEHLSLSLRLLSPLLPSWAGFTSRSTARHVVSIGSAAVLTFVPVKSRRSPRSVRRQRLCSRPTPAPFQSSPPLASRRAALLIAAPQTTRTRLCPRPDM
jgi:hypothetical protein